MPHAERRKNKSNDISISYKVLSTLNFALDVNNPLATYFATGIISIHATINLTSAESLQMTILQHSDNTSNGHFLLQQNVTQLGFNSRNV